MRRHDFTMCFVAGVSGKRLVELRQPGTMYMKSVLEFYSAHADANSTAVVFNMTAEVRQVTAVKAGGGDGENIFFPSVINLLISSRKQSLAVAVSISASNRRNLLCESTLLWSKRVRTCLVRAVAGGGGKMLHLILESEEPTLGGGIQRCQLSQRRRRPIHIDHLIIGCGEKPHPLGDDHTFWASR